MFESLKVKQLKKLISDYKKENNVFGSVSKMKKKQLVDSLSEHFVLENNKLVLKKHVTKTTNNIATLRSESSNLTKGQQRLNNTINKLESSELLKERMKKDLAFSKRLKGN
jgi:cell division protein FtsB